LPSIRKSSSCPSVATTLTLQGGARDGMLTP
jgi:hypothetical protein